MAPNCQSTVAHVCKQEKAHLTAVFLIEYSFFCSVLTCLAFIVPCHYIWLYYLSPVDDHLFKQYQFGCIAVAVSCVIEQIAEVPSFVTQINCKLRLRIVLDCIHLTVRSVIFIYLVVNNPDRAIEAFATAQIVSSIVFTLGFYGYYYVNIGSRKEDGASTLVLQHFSQLFPFFKNKV